MAPLSERAVEEERLLQASITTSTGRISFAFVYLDFSGERGGGMEPYTME